MKLKIHSKQGDIKLEFTPGTNDRQVEDLMKEFSLSQSFTHYDYIPLSVGDYIEIK